MILTTISSHITCGPSSAFGLFPLILSYVNYNHICTPFEFSPSHLYFAMGSCMSSLTLPSGKETGAIDGAPISSSKRTWSFRKRSSRNGDGRKEKEDSAVGGMRERELRRIPGRMFLNGSSDVACIFTKQGKKGTNQDSMLVWEDFGSSDDTIFCGVFDGHGPIGHSVARKVRDLLPVKLLNEMKASSNDVLADLGLQDGGSSDGGSFNSAENAYVAIGEYPDESCFISDDAENFSENYFTIRRSLLKAFDSVDKQLELHPTFDCYCSGTTAVSLVKQGQELVIGNVGDSRAVLGYREKDNSMAAVQLTVDLKPNLPGEAARIQQCHGRVFAMPDEPEVARIWLPDSDGPGLAMARAFGDFCLKDHGLISVPDITYRRLTDRDEFVVLASDGVWDVFSNEEVVEIVASAPNHAKAAEVLVTSAVQEWRVQYPTSKIDDCTAVCLFLRQNARQTKNSQMRNPYTNAAGIEEITAENTEWSALDGVTRVNSLLNIPRDDGRKRRL